MTKYFCVFVFFALISSCNLLGLDSTNNGSVDVGFDAIDLAKNIKDTDTKDSNPDISKDVKVFVDTSSDAKSGCDAGGCDQGSSTVDSPLLAFPGAKGFGADVKGGRGGRVIYVTNLNDSGDGSLRKAVEDVGPRIVVFRVGGTIMLESQIELSNPFITIAGHTAPGEGITVRGNGARNLNLFYVSTREVIFRHLRLRRGPSTVVGDCDGYNILMGSGDQIIIDHVSASWAPEILLNMWSSTNISVQNSIFSESLLNSTLTEDCMAAGPPQPKAFGASTGGDSKNISFFENLFTHHTGMTPLLASNQGGDFEVINNLVYNVCYAIGFSGQDGFEVRGNFIGNYIKAGYNSCSGHRNNILVRGNAKAYLRDNLTPFREAGEDEWLASSEQQVKTPADIALKADAEFEFPIKDAISAENVHDEIPTRVGANLVTDKTGKFVKFVDPIDLRIVNEALSGTKTLGSVGRRIDHPDEVGGWVDIADGVAYPDGDEDGMPDAWEDQYGLDKTRADGNDDPDGDGYTNIEEYLNQTLPK